MAWAMYQQYRKAEPYIKAAIEYRALAQAGNTLAAAGDFELAANIYSELGRFAEAEENYQKALVTVKELTGADSDRTAGTLHLIGYFYDAYALYDKAQNYFERTLKIYSVDTSASADRKNIAILIDISKVLEGKGAYLESIAYLERALNREGKRDIDIGVIRFNLGLNHAKIGNFDLAESFLQSALVIFRQLAERDIYSEGQILQALANLQAEQKELATASQTREQALQCFRAVYGDDHPEVARSLENLSVDYLDLGQLDSSLQYIQKAITILKAAEGQEWELATAYNSMADVYLAKKDWGQAEGVAQKAIDLQEKINERHANLAYSHNILATIHLARHQPQSALQAAHRAVLANHPTFADVPDPTQTPLTDYFKYDYYFESILHKAAAFRGLGQYKEALDQYKIADQVLDGVKYQINSRKDKVNLADAVYRLSKAAIAQSVAIADQKGDVSYHQTAFYFSEKSKANVLLQSIANNRAKNFGDIPDSLIVREEALQANINYYSIALASQPDSAQIPIFREELFKAQQAHAALIQQFETDYPAYYELKFQHVIPDLAAIREELVDEQAILSYFTADSTLYIFYLDRDQFQVHQSPITAGFAADLQTLRDGIALQLEEEYFSQAHSLYQLLFPFTIPDHIEELVLIPDGSLTQIPFEALLTQRVESTTDFRNLPYLLRQYKLSYAPSAALFHQLRRDGQEEHGAEGLLAYAPVFSEPKKMDIMVQDFFSKLSASEQRAFTPDGEIITPLPGTAKELEAIGAVFRQKGIPVTMHTYEKAREAQIKTTDTRSYRYLHIATHGFVNETNPDLSGLLFYPDTSSTEDGVLASGEVYSLKLNADLVVLSACQTGMGKITYGEGILGLSQAFLYAGAKNLMVSLWKVDDQATAQLMTNFYKNHLQPHSFNVALRQAKLQLINSDAYAHPYFWSAFLLMGK